MKVVEYYDYDYGKIVSTVDDYLEMIREEIMSSDIGDGREFNVTILEMSEAEFDALATTDDEEES